MINEESRKLIKINKMRSLWRCQRSHSLHQTVSLKLFEELIKFLERTEPHIWKLPWIFFEWSSKPKTFPWIDLITSSNFGFASKVFSFNLAIKNRPTNSAGNGLAFLQHNTTQHNQPCCA